MHPSALIYVVCAVSIASATSCARRRPAPCRTPVEVVLAPAPAPDVAPAFDRDAERRSVLATVLAEVFGTDAHDKPVARYVVDPELGSGGDSGWDLSDAELAKLRARGLHLPEPIRLPGGSRTQPPDLKGLDPSTIADWTKQAGETPMPRDLVADRPIEWLTTDELLAIPIRPEEADVDEGSWRAFHRVFPGSSGHIRLSDVGFSRGFDHALVRASSVRGGHDGACYWILLRKRDGRWTVVERQLEWIA